MAIQKASELDEFYSVEDPWHYDETQADELRATLLLSELPSRGYRRVLDIGCGNGFVTLRLPGAEIFGVDLSERAIEWSQRRASARPDADRFTFRPASIFDMDPTQYGRFDLIVITGVIYPQYVGKAFSFVALSVDRLLNDGGILASVHIDEWCPWRFPYTLVHGALYPYRQFTHRMEIYEK